MAYNKENLLNRIIAIQEIVLRESKKGTFQKAIYEKYVKDSYHISYATFNNYLGRNAKQELIDYQNQKNKG